MNTQLGLETEAGPVRMMGVLRVGPSARDGEALEVILKKGTERGRSPPVRHLEIARAVPSTDLDGSLLREQEMAVCFSALRFRHELSGETAWQALGFTGFT